MKKQLIKVVAAVIFDGRKLLAAQRPAGKASAGAWEFPGGKVEPGETLEQALKRELREELALEVTVLDEMCSLQIDTAEKILELHFLRALKRPGSTAESCEKQEFRWLELTGLAQVDWLPADKEFVKFLSQCKYQ